MDFACQCEKNEYGDGSSSISMILDEKAGIAMAC